MPRKTTQQTTAAAEIASEPPQQNQQPTSKIWAEPYRPIVTNREAGFELGEDKRNNVMIFIFAGDPGQAIKEKLKHFGYMYNGKQRTWTVNATPTTREIARRMADEFAGGKDKPAKPVREPHF